MPADEQGPPGPSRDDTRWRADSVLLLAATVVLLLARIPVMGVRFFDPDEFEHAHAAWSVFKGLLPYKDFFEHHTPWYYFALSPFFRWFAVDQSFDSARHFLVFARGLSLTLTALSVFLMFQVGRLGASRKMGLLAALFLAGQPVVIQKTLEIRPDVFALPFFLAGLWFLLRALSEPEEPARRSLRWFLGSGLALGAAIMCTQKMLFVLPGAFAGLGLWALADGRRRLFARTIAMLAVVAGIAVPVATTWIAFAVQGSGGLFIDDNFFLNAHMRTPSSKHLAITLETSWPVVALCVLGASVAMYRFWRANQRHYRDVVLLCILVGLIAGLLVVPAAYRQYYLMPLPIVCVFAAQGLRDLLDRARERVRGPLLAGATALLLIYPVADLVRSFTTRRDDRQMARLRYVFEHTRPTDPVLDGWLGTGVFRPHPLYYFFMHREVLTMLSDADLDRYLQPLESGKVRPALITVDDELRALGPRFMWFLQNNYVSRYGMFYVPAR